MKFKFRALGTKDGSSLLDGSGERIEQLDWKAKHAGRGLNPRVPEPLDPESKTEFLNSSLNSTLQTETRECKPYENDMYKHTHKLQPP